MPNKKQDMAILFSMWLNEIKWLFPQNITVLYSAMGVLYTLSQGSDGWTHGFGMVGEKNKFWTLGNLGVHRLQFAETQASTVDVEGFWEL